MISVGVVPSASFFTLLVLVAPVAGARFANLNISSLYGFIVFLLGGFSEEVVWRGYIQTRLIARSGKLYGWLISSVAFSLWHLPINYRLYGGTAEALGVSLLVQFPLGLAFGYMMIRTQNILPSSIYHLFFDWTPSLFQIPGL
jgi:membrane protease YdiL (CAAX protease family)